MPKGGQAPSSSGSATPEAFRRRPVDVSVRTHVSGIGWQGAVRGGATAGTTGRSLPVEALQVGLTDQQLPGSVQVRAHVSNVGWQTGPPARPAPPAAASGWRPCRSGSPARWPLPTTCTTASTRPT